MRWNLSSGSGYATVPDVPAIKRPLAQKEEPHPTNFKFHTIELDGCCGVKVIHGLDQYTRFHFLHPDSRKNALMVLRNETSDEGFNDEGAEEAEDTWENPEGIALVTLSQHQIDLWHKILLEAGFVLKEQGNNKKTENDISLYTKVIHPIYKRS